MQVSMLMAVLWGMALMATPGQARVLDTLGAVYEIAEPDALSELKERVSRAPWGEILGKEEAVRKVRGYRPRGLSKLPKASESKKRLVDVTYRLQEDLVGVDGKVAFPKGFAVNPLQHVWLSGNLVFLDASDPEQVAWFRESPYFGEIATRLILTGGSWYELMERLEIPVYYADGKIVERFQIRRVPTVVRQSGELLELEEVEVSPRVDEK
jgi:conjugal transfer pilus assembly protein TraW